MLASLAGSTSCTRYLSAAAAYESQSATSATSVVQNFVEFFMGFIVLCSHSEVHGRGRARVHCCCLALCRESSLRDRDRVRAERDPRGSVIAGGVGGGIDGG